LSLGVTNTETIFPVLQNFCPYLEQLYLDLHDLEDTERYNRCMASLGIWPKLYSYTGPTYLLKPKWQVQYRSELYIKNNYDVHLESIVHFLRKVDSVPHLGLCRVHQPYRDLKSWFDAIDSIQCKTLRIDAGDFGLGLRTLEQCPSLTRLVWPSHDLTTWRYLERDGKRYRSGSRLVPRELEIAERLGLSVSASSEKPEIH